MPPRWATDVATNASLWAPTFLPLLNETAPTCSSIWCMGHKIASYPAVLRMSNESTLFAGFYDWWSGPGFLASHVDPATAMWCDRAAWAPPNCACLGGAFHMDLMLTNLSRGLFLPARLLNVSLGLQRTNGLWCGDTAPGFIDLDGVYQVVRAAAQLGTDEAWALARGTCQTFLATAALVLNDPSKVLGNPYGENSHLLPGAVTAVAECAKWFPDAVKTVRPWRQTLDYAPFV